MLCKSETTHEITLISDMMYEGVKRNEHSHNDLITDVLVLGFKVIENEAFSFGENESVRSSVKNQIKFRESKQRNLWQ